MDNTGVLKSWHQYYDKKPDVIATIANQKLDKVRTFLTSIISDEEWFLRERWAGFHKDKGSLSNDARCRRCGILIFMNKFKSPICKEHNQNIDGTCPHCHDKTKQFETWESLMKHYGWYRGISKDSWINRDRRLFVEYTKRGNITEGQYRRLTMTTP